MLQVRRDVVTVETDEKLYSIVAHHPTKPYIKDIIRAFNFESAVDIFMNKNMGFYDLTVDGQTIDSLLAVKELSTFRITATVVETGV